MNACIKRFSKLAFLPLTLLILFVLATAGAADNGCQNSAGSGIEQGGITDDASRWDQAALEHTLAYAQRQRSSAVVIVDHGELVAECYWPLETGAGPLYANLLWGRTGTGAPIEDVASLQKSIVSILVGVAVDQGLLRLDAPVSTYLDPGWTNTRSDEESVIKVQHLLSMTSGLTPALEYQAPAGSLWVYNTRAYSKLVTVLEAVSGDDITQLTKHWLTGPVGMADTAWRQRAWVKPHMDANPLGIFTTARDLVHLGELMLARGDWQGRRVVSEAYVDTAITPSQDLNPGYGLLWWLNGQPLRTTPEADEHAALAPAAPADMYAAQGALGRKLYVVPSLGLVVARLGDAPDKDFNHRFWELLMAAVPGAPTSAGTSQPEGQEQ